MRPRRGQHGGSFLERAIGNAINNALSSVIHTTVHKVANTVVDTSVNKYRATKEAELAQYKLQQQKALEEAARPDPNYVREDEMARYPTECPNCAAVTDGNRYCKYCDGKLV